MGHLSRLLDLKGRIMIMLMFTFVYKLIRAGYFSAREKRLAYWLESNNPNLMASSKAHLEPALNSPFKFRTPTPTSQQSRAHQQGFAYKRLELSKATLINTNSSTSTHQRQKQRESEPSGWFGATSGPVGFTYERIMKTRAKLGKPVEQRASKVSPTTKHELDPSLFASQHDDCPLMEMPRFMRYYRRFSNYMIVYEFIKYTLISAIQFSLLGVDSYYNCFLPGRLDFLYDFIYELPGLSLVIIFYHIIYRWYLYFVVEEYDIDCFLFILYTKEAVRERELNVDRLLNNDQVGKQQRQTYYLANGIFYKRSPVTGAYRLKPNRGLDQWVRMKKFIDFITIVGIGGLAFWSVPLGIIIVGNLISNDYFDANYRQCRPLARAYRMSGWPLDDPTPNFQWDFGEPYRILCLLSDGFDNSFLLFDTANALVWPFATAMICSTDIYFGADRLLKCVIELKCRLERLLAQMDSQAGKCQRSRSYRFWLKSRRRNLEVMKQIEQDIANLQDDIMDLLTQVSQVDKFINMFAAFCMFGWAFVNFAYQLTAILVRHVLVPNSVIQYMQIIAYVIITMTFAYMGRIYTKSTQLYHGISSLVAMDPNYKTTKTSWLRVFEFYDQEINRYSFHIGPTTQLSLSNFWKFTVWFLSCTLVVLNLLRNNLDPTLA